MLRQATIFAFALLLFSFTFGQEKYTLSGYIKDAKSGEDVIAATVFIPEIKAGAYSNEYGFYSLTVPEGTYEVEYRYQGYETVKKTVELTSNQSMNIEMGQGSVQLEEVVISDEVEDANVTSTEVSTISVDIKKIRKMPALMGEVDVIKSIQLLPGVQGVGEGLSGYYVRGGSNDQNLILLDEATVFNASHVLGFFSVFNADALKSETKLYKSGGPAQYGGRLASVLDLRMREGNQKRLSGNGGIGLISSRLSFEAPIIKDKSSFIVSGRRTYADVFLKLSNNPDTRKTRAFFYDFNAKANYKFSDKDRIFLSGYFGKDVFKFEDLFGNDWGNATATLRWNHLFNEKLFSNTTLIYSDFNYGFEFGFGNNDRFEFRSGIRDFGGKIDFNWFANPKNQLRFGFHTTLHKFNPGSFRPISSNSVFQELEVDSDYAVESALYLTNQQKVSDRVLLEYGIRWSFFQHIGPGTEYEFDDAMENTTDTLEFNAGEIIQNYMGPEPRFAATFIMDEKSSFKASYTRTRQYLQLASNATASFPWDIWFPSSRHVRPQISDQVAVGYFRNFADNDIETSVELYYKWMQNQVDFKNGAELILNPTLETELLFGNGWSYGTELFVKKKFGKLTGWTGYTLSWTRRQIDGINNGDPYPAKNDRRHDISVIGIYQIAKRISVSATWVYATGNAVTFPRNRAELEGIIIPSYSSRNQDRMPAYHRMDLACNIDFKQKEGARFGHGLNISVYNVYNRKNAFSLEFRKVSELEDNVKEKMTPEELADPDRIVALKVYLFPIIPSVTYNFNF